MILIVTAYCALSIISFLFDVKPARQKHFSSLGTFWSRSLINQILLKSCSKMNKIFPQETQAQCLPHNHDTYSPQLVIRGRQQRSTSMCFQCEIPTRWGNREERGLECDWYHLLLVTERLRRWNQGRDRRKKNENFLTFRARGKTCLSPAPTASTSRCHHDRWLHSQKCDSKQSACMPNQRRKLRR